MMPTGSGRLSLTLLDQAITSATSLATSIIVARATSPHDFGLFVLGVSVVTLLLFAQDAAIVSPYLVHGPRMRGRLPAFAGSVFVHQVMLSGLAMAGLALGLVVVLVGGIGGGGLATVLMALVFALPFVLAKELVRRMALADLDQASALAVDAGAAVAQLAGLGALLMLGLLSPGLAIVVWGLAGAIAVGIYLVRRPTPLRVKLRSARHHLVLNWRLARWILPSTLAGAGSEYLSPLILAAVREPAAAGIFGACASIVGIAAAVHYGLSNYIAPRIAHTHAAAGLEAMLRYLWRASAWHVGAIAGLACVLAAVGDSLVVVVYGEAYGGVGAVVAALAAALTLAALNANISRALYVLERAASDLLVNALTLVLLLTLGVWLIWAFGPLGAALALLVRGAIAAAMRLLVILRCSVPERRA
jgi:O-antigen/teichoic acid export membrane protein